MIIDLHTRIWSRLDQLGADVSDRLRRRDPDSVRRLDGSPAAHEQIMSCVDAAAVFGFQSRLIDASVPNEYIAEFVAKDPRRRLGIAGIDPMGPDAIDEIEKAVDFGMVGVTVSPMCQGFHPTHSTAMRVYELCVERGLPLFVAPGAPLSPRSMLEFGRPVFWDEVARSLHDLPIVITGLGHPWVDETLALLGKHDRVYADISGVATRPWHLYNALLSAASLGVMDRLLFGSGFPLETPAKTIELLYSVNSLVAGTQLPTIPRSQVRAIIERDSLENLGIDVDIVQATTDPDVPDIVVPASGVPPADVVSPD